MTRLKKPADPVKPSAPDPVDAWLDVLVAMLSIPKPDRQRVRDELEDHLRSRIDDLLIHGLTESQALQKAVAELGETADLARQLSHAHKPPRTRRYAMHALLIALTGTVVALGVNTMRPQASTPAPVAVQSEAGAAALSGEPIPVRGQTLGEVLESFVSRSDRPVMVHWTLLQDIGLERDEPIEIDADPLRFGTILQLLAERTEPGLGDSIALLEAPDLIEVGLRSQFDQRTMQRRNYDLANLVGHEVRNPVTGQQATIARPGAGYTGGHGAMAIAQLLETHVSPDDWVRLGGDLARYSAMGNVLVITAPERIHAEIEATLTELDETQRASFQEAQSIARSRLETLDQQHQRLENEYRDLFDRWATVTENRSDATVDGVTDFERLDIIERTRADLTNRMQSIRIRQSAIESQIDHLAREWSLNRPDHATESHAEPDPSQGKVVYLVPSMGEHVTFVLPEGEELTIRGLLAANGIDPENPTPAFVTHYKAGEPRDQGHRVRIYNLFANPESDRAVGPGDTVALDNRPIAAPTDRTRGR